MVIHSIHVIVCFDPHTYHSPSRYTDAHYWEGWFILLLSIPASPPPQIHGKMITSLSRSTRIFYFRLKKRRVNIISRFRFKYISEDADRTNIRYFAPCDLLTSFYRIFFRFGNNLYFRFLLHIEVFSTLSAMGEKQNHSNGGWSLNSHCDNRHQVHIETIRDANTRNIAISESLRTGLPITPPVLKSSPPLEWLERISPKFPLSKRKVKRRYKGYLLLLLSIPSDAASQHQSSDISSHHSVHFFTPQMYTIPTKLWNIRGEWWP